MLRAGTALQEASAKTIERPALGTAFDQADRRARLSLKPRASRPGIAGTAYDTAWIASVADRTVKRGAQFPTALQWLIEHQHADGSWGGDVRYEHDRILSTLAALVPLATYGRRAHDRACVQKGTRYLWQHGHLLASEPVELVGFELLLPTLIQRARAAGISVPPHLDIYELQRAEKLRMIPPSVLYSSRATVVHSLEFLGEDVDLDRLAEAQGENGAVGNSPAATAFFYERTRDARAYRYLHDCMARSGGAMASVLDPCETFELLWAAHHLFLGGVPAAQLLGQDDRAALLHGLQSGGVSLSPSFPIPDADDTSVALVLLHDLGETVDARVLQRFALPDGHFASFPYERHGSVGVNLHVLQALLRVPGYPEADRVIATLVDYIVEQQQRGLYWIDKWHISPYYATARALCILSELPADLSLRVQPAVDRARAWIRFSQNGDGSWGFYGPGTAEETAYATLALTCGNPGTGVADRKRCAVAMRYLATDSRSRQASADPGYPPLWIDKCLYTPTLIVQAAIEGARAAVARAA